MNVRNALLAAVALLALAPLAHAAGSYVLDPAKSTLSFHFVQAGAQSEGRFSKFDVKLALPENDPASGRLDVTVQVASVDTKDKERDGILRGADLFAVDRFPTARFTASKIESKGSDRYEATGKLTIRDVTRDVTIPFTFRSADGAGQMSGEFVIKRLQFGVGQGEWKSTEWVGDDVKVSFNLRLVPEKTAS
ncbi:MAG: YceI family protein [Pseudomonadota bacterium]|jgi:Uncharacterized conserved protein|nr:MAG: polyisoprenoid-binding protein [Pseudomonadota bacterium]